ncbi:hypothetical protein FDZ63_02505 [Ehrlichia ruminantium]|nr:hypothetical protein FDZ65_02510 [Ehrlichia ruminantium]QLK54199.1 hypothetical protein FDZ63_02505 [Ehrlichia ruminantium]QLK56951.1 hypothetical protein FDZ60_02515 [Ehrlichia ruminantium]
MYMKYYDTNHKLLKYHFILIIGISAAITFQMFYSPNTISSCFFLLVSVILLTLCFRSMLKRSDPKPLIPSEILEPIKQKDECIKFSYITKQLKKHSSTLIAGLFIVTICILVALFCPANVNVFHKIASHCLSLASLMIIILCAYDILKLFKPDNFLTFKIPIYTEDKKLLDNLVSSILKIHDVNRVEVKNYEEPELD